MIWHKILTDLKSFECNETETRPTEKEELANLFTAYAIDPAATELEYLNLLNALVMVKKPRLVLETGTASGLGTLAIASALDFNKRGRLITVDENFCNGAKSLVRKYGLSDYVSFQWSYSLAYLGVILEDKAEVPDFAFLDSEVDVRHKEWDLLLKMQFKGTCIFHDTSEIRTDYRGRNNEYLKGVHRIADEVESIEFIYSRGLTVIDR
jgi:predicted O-methyltransferase YrrM